VEEQKEKLWKRLEMWQHNSDAKMTKTRYLEMMEQLGNDPVESEVPPDTEDFPYIVLDALETFNGLGDRIYPEIGYIGKDYTNLPYYMKICKVEDEDLFLSILLRLDAEAINMSQKRLKAAMDKVNRKHG
jgi:hypothetical protein